MNINSPKVSVILPIYNQEKFLQKALDSLSGQTLTDTEYICVNDGSTDNSLRIMNEHAKKDPRFKIINQPNLGTGRTRNNGIKHATGEYIAFLDPDDWFEPEALSSLYKRANEQNCDMLVFDYNVVDEAGNLIKTRSMAEKTKSVSTLTDGAIFNWRDIQGRIFGGIGLISCNKLYRREFINAHNLHFANCSFAEDNPFVLGSTLYAQRIGYSATPYYNYRSHNNSAVHTVNDRNLCIFKAFDALKQILRECGLLEELSNEFDTYVVKRCNTAIKRVESKDTFEKVRHQRLSIRQNQIVDNLRETGPTLLSILDGLKLKK